MNRQLLTFWRILLCVVVLALGAGCASTETVMRDDPDPFEGFNRTMYSFNDKVDKLALKPAAQIYKAVVPGVVNDGVTNFFSNLDDVVVLFNDLLQLKFEQAAMDTSRIVYNSIFGLLGVFDVASHMGLPKHEEDFGQTLGYWGVGEGYYLVLPLIGSSTTRDVWSIPVDSLVDLIGRYEEIGKQLALRSVYVVDLRADTLRAERAFGGAALDPYAFFREAYLQRRRNLVYDGNPPRPDFLNDDFDLEDDEPVPDEAPAQ